MFLLVLYHVFDLQGCILRKPYKLLEVNSVCVKFVQIFKKCKTPHNSSCTLLIPM